MDKYIEIIAPYWISWQQTAFDNPQFSAVLAISAFLISYLIIAILKGLKIAGLNRQLAKQKTILEQAESKQDDFLTQQKKDSEQIAHLQQQAEQLTSALEKEKQDHQSNLSNKDDLIISTENDRKREIESLNSTVAEKNQHTEQLQHKLSEQIANIAQYDALNEKFVAKEKQASQSGMEISAINQQLQTELTHKNELSEQLDAKTLLISNQAEQISELQRQVKEVRSHIEMERIDQQLTEHPSEKKQPTQLDQTIEPEIASTSTAEAITVMTEQPSITQEKKVPLTPKEQPIPTPAPIATETIHPTTEELPTPIKPILKAPTAPKTGKKGVLGWFKSMDNAIDNNKIVAKILKPNDVIATEQPTNPPVIEQTVKKPDPIVITEDKPTPAPTIKKRPIPVVKIADDEESSFSEKLADMADKMDSFQGKFKGLFGKK